MKLSKLYLFLSIPIFVGIGGCKKSFLDTKPTDEVALTDAFKTTKGCKAALQGINRLMFDASSEQVFGEPSIMMMEDMMGNDLVVDRSNWLIDNYDYTGPRNGAGTAGSVWSFYYQIISNANLIIANVDAAEGLEEDKKFIKGQALFYRAFSYYKLTLYYQQTLNGVATSTDYGFSGAFKDQKGVPIYLTPSQEGSPRPKLSDNYAQIVKDLDDALLLLPNGTRVDKTDPDLSVAKGLYARVAMVMGKWDIAAQMASEARDGYDLMSGNQLLTGFNDIGSSEWIWGCSINAEQTGIYASFASHMIRASGGYAEAMPKIGFKPICDTLQRPRGDVGDTLDVRKNWWYGTSNLPANTRRYEQKKFKMKRVGSWVGDLPFMRSAEMYLIEAEARAQAGQTSQAQQLLETFVKTRNSNFVAKTDKVALLQQIIMQRRIELWGEGFRFSDIKRYMAPAYSDIIADNDQGRITSRGIGGLASNHSSTLIGSSADLSKFSRFFLFRIPSNEINANKAFTGADQNP